MAGWNGRSKHPIPVPMAVSKNETLKEQWTSVAEAGYEQALRDVLGMIAKEIKYEAREGAEQNLYAICRYTALATKLEAKIKEQTNA